MIWLVIILLALAAYLIFFISQFINIFFRGYAPFISTDRETIRKIISAVQAVPVKEPAIIYELGCGRARFLRMMEKVHPQTRTILIGIENLSALYLINKLRLKLQGSRIELLKRDFLTVDLKSAALIYCYLNNTTMAKLGEKFRRECRAGTRIISRSFPIPQFKPEKIMTIKNKKIYFYVFQE